jgi:Holliday junction DNA helicase RuvA
MIAHLRGEVIGINDDSLVVDVGGVGFKVFAAAAVRDQNKPGDRISLYTYLVVREDVLALYGFERQEERDIFVLLLGVNGVGPRIAMAVVSTLSVDVIRNAVAGEQADVFGRVSGVGKMTAQKIILHLKGKIATAAVLQGATVMVDVDGEVVEALTNLGYSVVEAQAAVQSIPRDTPDDVETRLRIALKYFST